MPSIQRQTILSSIFIYIGFGIGAFNLFLQPFVLDPHYVGLAKVVNDFAIVAADIALLGTSPVLTKFFPYYRHFLPKEKIDLPFVTTATAAIGTLIVLTITWLAKDYIILIFGKNDFELFSRFYWTVFPYIICWLVFVITEPMFWVMGKSVIYNVVKETGFRLLTTFLLLLLLLKVIHFTGYMYSYAFLYLIPAAFTVSFVVRSRSFSWYPHISKVTRRMKGKMLSFAGFLFFTGLLTLSVRVCDTLFLAGQKSFSDAGVFVYALYFSQILDVPNRSIVGGAVPVLVEYWRTKNLKGIASIYRKSAINLMVAGLFLGGLITINLPSVVRFFPSYFKIPILPTVILIIGQFINLATGLNAQIIHTSSRWRFDFISTIIYSVLSLPLNFFFIRHFGIIGAALASLLSSLFYNTYRWIFLYRQFNLQPFTRKNAELLLIAVSLTAVIYFLPRFPDVFAIKFLNLAIDIVIKTVLFTGILGPILVKRHYSEEVNFLWTKWSGKLLKPFNK